MMCWRWSLNVRRNLLPPPSRFNRKIVKNALIRTRNGDRWIKSGNWRRNRRIAFNLARRHGVEPRPGREAHHAGPDVIGDPGAGETIAAIIIQPHDIAIADPPQDARDVNTKFSKTFATWFFPVGDETRQIIECWIEFLKTDLQFGPDEPLFPATKIGLGANHQFEVVGLDRKHWSNAGPIRKIFRQAFEAAGLPYFNPHSFRDTLAQLGERTCRTPEEFKAWSQNLGHDKVMTTFSSYGAVASGRQATLIRSLGKPQYAENDALVLIEDVLRTARLKRL
jgi:hypothetical protein